MADVVVSDCDAARCEGEPLNPQEHPVLDDAAAAAQQEPLSVPVDSLNDDKELEVKKKRLLEELQSALVPPIPNPKPVRPSSLALGIEVIDETALLETIPKASKNAKQSRRRAAKGAKKYTHNKTKTVTEFEEQKELTRRNSSSSSESQKKKKYSRKDMEALRFVNVSQQRKFWKALYAALPTPVSDEYHTLLAAVTATAHPLPSLPNKKPILTSTSPSFYHLHFHLTLFCVFSCFLLSRALDLSVIQLLVTLTHDSFLLIKNNKSCCSLC